MRPIQEVPRILQWLEGSTARGANQVLARIAAYIENNPVQAGLAADPVHYRWSSAWQGGELKFAAAR